VLERVAIAIIDRNADKATLNISPGKISLGKSSMHLIETDDFETGASEKHQDTFEKRGRYLKKPVRLKPLGPPRSNMMQRQDGANAGVEWRIIKCAPLK